LLDPISLYVHVPFCQRRCPYCAFYSVESAREEEITSYPRLLLKELQLIKESWRGSSIGTIYFGGGTPSILPPSLVESVISAAKEAFQFEDDIEVTLECNPGTVDAGKIEAFISAGINRLSIGIQALNDDRLGFLGRIHDMNQAVETLKIATEAAGVDVSADLMVGTPLDTRESWDRELEKLLPFRPDSLSFYSLTVEEGTDLALRLEKNEKISLGSDEVVDLMMYIGDRLADAGYRHYEVSNWALPGHECRHNLHYWRRGRYIGLGPSAHSFDGKRRSWNKPDVTSYREALNNGNLPPSEYEVLSDAEVMSEWVYLALRVADGLDFGEYQEMFGEVPSSWKSLLEKTAASGYGDFDGVRFKPNDRGLLLADEISARILG